MAHFMKATQKMIDMASSTNEALKGGEYGGMNADTENLTVSSEPYTFSL
jgi:hypothetical protein